MTDNLKGSEWTNLVNIHYGACLSVVVAASFTVGGVGAGEPGEFTFLAHPTAWPEFIPMLVYFFIDWLAINVRRSALTFGLPVFFASTLWIWFLGFCVIVSKSSSGDKFIFIGIYLFVSNIYHISQYFSHHYTQNKVLSWFGMLSTTLIIVPSILIAFNGFLHYFDIANGEFDSTVLQFVLWLVVGLKFFEFSVFHRGQAELPGGEPGVAKQEG